MVNQNKTTPRLTKAASGNCWYVRMAATSGMPCCEDARNSGGYESDAGLDLGLGKPRFDGLGKSIHHCGQDIGHTALFEIANGQSEFVARPNEETHNFI